MFLNCTAHELTPEQVNLANEYSETIQDLKADNNELHTKLVNCPPDIKVIQELALAFIEYLTGKYNDSNHKLTVHLPIGSPAFMAVFFMTLDRHALPVRIVFSHSDRVSVEEKQPDGSVVKRGVFRFVKFIDVT